MSDAAVGTADIGVTGLAVMGRNLARNLARHGHTVALHNRTFARTESLVADHGDDGTFVPAESLARTSWRRLSQPRAIIVMVKAGEPTDAVIQELVPLLDEGDIVIDCGNAHFADTRRREAELREHGLHFVGCGVSGGEEGALNGPSIMPGGSAESYEKLGPILTSIAAQVDGTPCCVHVGPDGAGHFVKMVHNGIEYADMQLIAEAYDLLRHGLSATAGRDRRHLRVVERGRPRVVPHRDHRRPCSATPTPRPARRSSTSCSTRPSRRAPAAGRCRARSTSACRSPASPRRRSRGRCPGTPSSASPPARRSAPTSTSSTIEDRDAFIEDVRRALYASKVVAYAQGFDQIAAGSAEYDWDVDRGAMATIWRGGCIIRARFLDRIREAYDDDADLPSLLVAPYFADAVRSGVDSWRRVVAQAATAGIPTPAFSSSLAYYDGLRRDRLPAALIQGLRDNFGAHTYRRVDRDGSFHTEWAGDRAEHDA